MNKYEQALRIANLNNGIVLSKKAQENNIENSYLLNLTKKGKLVKIDRGIYVLPQTLDDEFYYYQNIYQKAIYSHDTALYLHNLSERTPHRFIFTVPQGYNTSNIKNNKLLKPITSTKYNAGVEIIKSPYGNNIKVYNIERTLCSLLQKKHQISFETFKYGFIQYLEGENKNIEKLIFYANMFQVKQKIELFLKILL